MSTGVDQATGAVSILLLKNPTSRKLSRFSKLCKIFLFLACESLFSEMAIIALRRKHLGSRGTFTTLLFCVSVVENSCITNIASESNVIFFIALINKSNLSGVF